MQQNRQQFPDAASPGKDTPAEPPGPRTHQGGRHVNYYTYRKESSIRSEAVSSHGGGAAYRDAVLAHGGTSFSNLGNRIQKPVKDTAEEIRKPLRIKMENFKKQRSKELIDTHRSHARPVEQSPECPL